ncbi:ribonuclease H-like domain-containing protein [Tanacetum coccineum]
MMKLMNLINEAPSGNVQANMAGFVSNKIVGTGSENGGLYMFDYVSPLSSNSQTIDNLFVVCFISKSMWHNRLDHPYDQAHSDFQSSLSPNDDGRVDDTLHNDGNDHSCSSNADECEYDFATSMGKTSISEGNVHINSDIAYAVHCLSQYMHSPLNSHLDATLRVLRYLKGSPRSGIQINKTGNLKLRAYANSDWARSSAKAEYRSMASATCEIAANLVFHEKSNHFEIDVHLVREKVASGVIKTNKIHTTQQIVNILTKGPQDFPSDNATDADITKSHMSSKAIELHIEESPQAVIKYVDGSFSLKTNKGTTEGFSHVMLATGRKPNTKLPHHIEILVSAVTQINEPDSLYGIIQTHKYLKSWSYSMKPDVYVGSYVSIELVNGQVRDEFSELSWLNKEWSCIPKRAQVHMNLLEPFIAFRKVMLQILESASILRKDTDFSQAALLLHCMEFKFYMAWLGRVEEAKLLRAQVFFQPPIGQVGLGEVTGTAMPAITMIFFGDVQDR